MFIHRIRSGSKKQFLKLLLRESYRVGNKVKLRTLANLSNWCNEDIVSLDEALKARRSKRPGAEEMIHRLVATRSFKSKPHAPFQILAALQRPHGTNPITRLPPVMSKGNR